jgi:hypothetical protein
LEESPFNLAYCTGKFRDGIGQPPFKIQVGDPGMESVEENGNNPRETKRMERRLHLRPPKKNLL